MPQLEKTLGEVLEADEFELPVGITINGKFHKTAKLTEMDGVAEEAISDKKIRNNYAKVVTEALTAVVERIGSHEKINRGIIKQLTGPDRDFLMLMNYKVSMGDLIEWTAQCPKCDEKMDMKVNVDDIPVHYVREDEPKEHTYELPRGIKDGDKLHKEITISMPTGFAQEHVFPIYFENESLAVSNLLQFITEKIGDMGTWNLDTFRKMGRKDRAFIAKKMGEEKVGADLSPETTCPSCQFKHKQPIPAQVLLGE